MLYRTNNRSAETASPMPGVVHPRVTDTAYGDPPLSADRRRSPRRRLRKPTIVGICAPDATRESRAEGVLLNVSTDGLACRIATEHLGALAVRGSVRLQFRLPGTSNAFDLAARVVNVTQAGSSGHCVVGLEFIGETPDGRRELGRALEAFA